MRACLDCPRLGNWKRGRCPDHDRARDKARGTKAERGYGAAHTQLRGTYQRRMNAGESFTCWRCGDDINPEHWHLGHDDYDRSIYRGPECPPCNLATKGR